MNLQEFTQLTGNVKGRLVGLVTGALVPNTPAEPGEKVPKIIPKLVIDQDFKAWANKLKSDRHVVNQAGQDLKWVHAFMLYHKGIQDYPDKTVGCAPFRLLFGIDSFYQHDPGTELYDPEEQHNMEISVVALTLWSARPFGVPKVKSVSSIREQRSLTKLGDVAVRHSMMTVAVTLEPVTIAK